MTPSSIIVTMRDTDLTPPPPSGKVVVPRERRRRRRRPGAPRPDAPPSFGDRYAPTGEVLGCGSYGRVLAFADRSTGVEVAVKIIGKEEEQGQHDRARVLKEIETFYLCQNQENILQLLEFFEEPSNFFLIFEKMEGGPLLDHIQKRGYFSEEEASRVVRDLASALHFLHGRGIAHRDLKPENVLCVRRDRPVPVKLCDFDLCSQKRQKRVSRTNSSNSSSSCNNSSFVVVDTTPKLQTPVGSLEYMAPEVLNVFLRRDEDEFDDDKELTYDKKCDLWSLGVILYILLCGNPPFVGCCGLADCGWDRGEACQDCQTLLSDSIRRGEVRLTGKPWDDEISGEAKDLLRRLLDRNVENRIDTNDLRNHPWISSNHGSSHLLGTPGVLARQTSLQDLTAFAGSAVTINRRLFGADAAASALTSPVSAGARPFRMMTGRSLLPLLRSPSSPSCHIAELSVSKSAMLQRRSKMLSLMEGQKLQGSSSSSVFCSIEENVKESSNVDK